LVLSEAEGEEELDNAENSEDKSKNESYKNKDLGEHARSDDETVTYR
jgi:hypothetical protein